MTTDGFEGGVSGWTPFSGTFAQDATHVHSGAWAAKLVVTGSPTSTGARFSVAATAGQPYVFTMWAFATGSTTNVQATIGWQDASHASISDSVTTVTLAANTWTAIIVTATAPALTAFATYGPSLTSSPSTGKTIWVDDTSFLFNGPAISAAQDSNWPPRIILGATGMTIGDVMTIYRVQSGVRTPVRNADAVTMADTSAVVYDSEYSFGLPTTYVLNLDAVDSATSNALTPTLPGGNVALSDAISGGAVECLITAWPDRTTDRGSATFNVGGRTVVVSPPRGQFQSQLELMTLTEVDRESMIDLLTNATSGIVLIRAPDASVYPGFDFHLAVLTDDERIYIQSGTDPRRLWTLGVVESSGWAPTLVASGWTWNDVADAYSGLTWADVPTDFATWEQFEVFDWGLGL